MTLRIERVSTGGRVIIRLIGRMRSEHLAHLTTEITGPAPKSALDLQEVTLVDIEVVQFLVACEDGGVDLLHCSPYIRRWMARERSSQA
jgi:hypothetical protein